MQSSSFALRVYAAWSRRIILDVINGPKINKYIVYLKMIFPDSNTFFPWTILLFVTTLYFVLLSLMTSPLSRTACSSARKSPFIFHSAYNINRLVKTCPFVINLGLTYDFFKHNMCLKAIRRGVSSSTNTFYIRTIIQ